MKKEFSIGKISKASELVVESYTYNSKNEISGIETNRGKLMVSNWKESLIKSFENVEFITPKKNDYYMRFIDSHPVIKKNGEIFMSPSYYRRGVFVKSKGNKDVLITRCYKHIKNEETKEIPLGRRLAGTVDIKKSQNSKTGEQRIIINFFYIPGAIADKKIVIGEQSTTNDMLQLIIPKTDGKQISVIPLK